VQSFGILVSTEVLRFGSVNTNHRFGQLLQATQSITAAQQRAPNPCIPSEAQDARVINVQWPTPPLYKPTPTKPETPSGLTTIAEGALGHPDVRVTWK
jgi:hypothetical protein